MVGIGHCWMLDELMASQQGAGGKGALMASVHFL